MLGISPNPSREAGQLTNMGSLILIGCGAGLTSALLFSVITTGSPLALILYIVAPLPVMIATLGWNHRTGLVASVIGALALMAVFNFYTGVAFFAGIAFPGWLFGYLALLSRETEGGTEWYPPGRILAAIAFYAAGMTILGTFLIGGDYDTYVRGFERIVEAYAKADPQLVAALGGDSSKADLARFLAQVAPPLSAAISVLFSAGLMWIASKAVERSGRLIRPFPLLRDTEMPRRVVLIFGVAIVLALVLSDFPGLFARITAASLGFAYALQGLAVVHALTLGLGTRIGILSGVYFTLLLIPGWPFAILCVIGLADTFFGWRAKKNARPPLNPTPLV